MATAWCTAGARPTRASTAKGSTICRQMLPIANAHARTKAHGWRWFAWHAIVQVCPSPSSCSGAAAVTMVYLILFVEAARKLVKTNRRSKITAKVFCVGQGTKSTPAEDGSDPRASPHARAAFRCSHRAMCKPSGASTGRAWLCERCCLLVPRLLRCRRRLRQQSRSRSTGAFVIGR